LTGDWEGWGPPWFSVAGYDGNASGTETFDGETTTIVFQHPALDGRDIHRVTVQRIHEGDVTEEYTLWLTSEAERLPQPPHAYVASNEMKTVWREGPKRWWVYPNGAPYCCGVYLHSIRWSNWGEPDAYATARADGRVWHPGGHVKVHVYGRTVIRHQGDPISPGGRPAPFTSYGYKYVNVKWRGHPAVKWKLDFPSRVPG
jgi:hypothetical protein